MSARKHSLATRFQAALFLFFVAGILAWGLVAVASAERRLRAGTDDFLEISGESVDEVIAKTADDQAGLMDRAVRQLSANLGTELQDVPFGVFEGRDELLVEFLRERLDDARRRHADNSRVISGLFRDDARSFARAELDAVRRAQESRSDELARSLRRDLLLWGGAFLAGIGLLIGFVFNRGVSRPIRRATDVIEAMKDGALDRRIDEADSEEIDRLARSFNAMADRLEAHQRELEGRVAEKTEALTRSLADQRATNERLRATVEELETTQRQLVESEKMAALGTMAKGMAHEFNNILGGVSGCAADLADDMPDEESRRVLDVIHKTSRRALVITENLLRFSRGSTHGPAEADLHDVVAESVSLVEPEATRRGISIALDGERGERIITDARGLQQVFLNLLINALQASEDGGEIDVTFRAEPGRQIVVVDDRGQGMAADVIERIFEPFFSTKGADDGPGGTGLGLSVARGIVDKLGGSLRAESAGPGQGSRFTVEVPTGASS